jgi:hypothetical protein
MKILFTLLLHCAFLCVSAQDRPNDFYVNKQGDTTFGTYVYGPKYDAFKTLKREKLKLKPDSIQSYSIYADNTNRRKGEPYYFARTWINIDNKFYEIYYRDSGMLSIVFSSPPPTPTAGMSSMSGGNMYYFAKKGSITKFYPPSFYAECQKDLADCPSVIDLLDHVPNEKNKEKTHKATFNDAEFIVSKYNECMRGK